MEYPMKKILGITLLLLLLCLLAFWLARMLIKQGASDQASVGASKNEAAQKNTPSTGVKYDTGENAGRELRLKMLNLQASELSLTPDNEYPKVFGLLMDWPLDDQVVTVVALRTGDASIYTTFKFGMIGGQAHPTIAAAAKDAARLIQQFYNEAKPVTEFPYPGKGHMYFYLLGYDGVRMIDQDAALPSARKYVELSNACQRVITEYRKLGPLP